MGRFSERLGHHYDKLDAGYHRVLRWLPPGPVPAASRPRSSSPASACSASCPRSSYPSRTVASSRCSSIRRRQAPRSTRAWRRSAASSRSSVRFPSLRRLQHGRPSGRGPLLFGAGQAVAQGDTRARLQEIGCGCAPAARRSGTLRRWPSPTPTRRRGSRLARPRSSVWRSWSPSPGWLTSAASSASSW